ncbi:MAG: right-handed parallel beta-helix repeat-containing protein [Planctomycetes bacterium]|nr:right-handed parallel beta-helix repeat-containing protein [Planctomycetota bacterium]
MKTGKRAILAVVVVLCFCGSIFAGVTIYVDVDVNGTGTGLSWENAYNYLQDALAVALSGDQIRVAQGSYTPDSNSAVPDGSDDPEAIFQLINGVTIKGGYAGCGEPYPYARDIELYETILTGDLSGDDGEFSYSDPNRRENSYHVVTGSGTDITAVMDGLTIADGRHWIVDYHNDDYYYSGAAGGMYNLYGSPTIKSCKFTCNIAVHAAAMYNYYSDPVIIDCNFISNVARENAGGIYNSKSNPVIMNCVFDNNRAFYSDGGGVYNRSSSSPKISGCIFKNNDAEYGGGICNDYSSSPIVSDCIFANNQGDEYGGGMYNDSNSSPTLTDCIFTDNDAEYGGGMYNDSDSSPILTNCIFSNNEADERGAGMYNIDSSSPILTNCLFTGGLSEGQGTGMCNIDSSNPILINCTFTANSSDYPYGATIYNNQSSPIITNSILWGNVDEIYSVGGTPIVTYSDVQGGWEGVGNIDIDPLFADANGPDGIVGSEDDNLRLSAGSLCINAGDNSAVTVAGDINGNTRIIDGTVDMGAYESNLIYVDADANGANNGSSWENAFNYLQDALDIAVSGAEIMVAQGSYTPDSNSAVPDGSGDREATFQLINGVVIKGGYAGFGEADPNSRDIELYETILSGDLDGNDANVSAAWLHREPTMGENSYHVVTSDGTDITAVLDGFTISGGNGNIEDFTDYGGGLCNIDGCPKIMNCKFMHNYADQGGGLYSKQEEAVAIKPQIVNCCFIENGAEEGGGLYDYGSDIIVDDCVFSYNDADDEGGAMVNRNSDPQIIGCIFEGNNTTSAGGAIMNRFSEGSIIGCEFTDNTVTKGNGGAIENMSSSPYIADCNFTGNSADYIDFDGGYGNGGAIYSRGYETCNPEIINCTFTNNTSLYGSGGAILNGNLTNTVVTKCIFNGNQANDGGAIRNIYCNSTVIGCTFTSNAASDSGGAISNDHVSNFELTDCTFIDNSSEDEGGAIENYETVSTVIDCKFIGNSARDGGGLYIDNEEGSTFTNCMFTGNWAEYGGGIWSEDEDVIITNCTFSGNSASNEGGGVYMDENIKFTNCIFWGNDVDGTMNESAQIIVRQSVNTIISHCCVQGWSGTWGGVGNIGADPLFIDADGADDIAGTEDDNLQLRPISPCINKGTNDTDPALPDKDIKGDPRIKNGVVDMGAYEFVHKIFVDDDAPNDPGPYGPETSDPLEDGTAEHPFDDIQEAIDVANDEQIIWVLPGKYYYGNLTFSGKNIILTSSDVNDWDVIEQTIISGSVQLAGTEDANCKLTGFTIYDPYEAAIYGNNSRATISHCVISRNWPCNATVIKDCDGIISNCLITDNQFYDCGQPRPVISGCGGLIKNCTIANNGTSAILVSDNKSLTIQNSIIVGNGTPQIEVMSGSTLNISYCDLGDDEVGEIELVNWGLGNFEGDPYFVNEAEWDYHLKSEGWRWSKDLMHGTHWTYNDVTSPCVDSGNPGSPLAYELLTIPDDPDNDWGANLRINVGAYGGTAQASMPPHEWILLGDLSNNDRIDYRDLSSQMENWLEIGAEQPGDLNRDGIVDMADFALLSKDWLQDSNWYASWDDDD